jgi:predicted HTH domain antitoxin
VNYKQSSFKGKVDFKIEFDDLKKISNIIDKSIKETEVLLRKEIEKLEINNDNS